MTLKYISCYEIKFRTNSEYYEPEPYGGLIKHVLAHNESEAIERAYQKLMSRFPEAEKDNWELEHIIKLWTSPFDVSLDMLKNAKEIAPMRIIE